MTVMISTGLRNGMLGVTGYGEAFANGVLYLYTGPQPTSADAAVQGLLLMKVTLNHGSFSFGSPTNGLNFGTPALGMIAKSPSENWQGIGIAAGVAGWFRLMGNAVDDLGTNTVLPRMDGTIANAGADMNMVNTTIAVGTPVTVDIFQYTLPAS